MTGQSESPGTYRTARSRRRGEGWAIRITPLGILFFVLINLFIVVSLVFLLTRYARSPEFGWLASHFIPTDTLTSEPATQTATASPSATIEPTDSPTPLPSATLTPVPATSSPQPVSTLTLNQGLILLALDEGGNTHLFAYQPQESGAGQPLPLTRLTSGPWDDINPAISPDGQTIAFSSNRSGYWDIYLLSLNSGGITRMTDTLAYDGAPAWSPDNQWLAYETYTNEHLEINILSVVNAGEAITLTKDDSANFSPAWSPQGRQIAFVSDRSGDNEIWLADLDKPEEARFVDISNNPNSPDAHPAWSPDGTTLAWAGEQDGIHTLFVQNMIPPSGTGTPQSPAGQITIGSGDWPAWSSDGEMILTIMEAPNHTYLTAYPFRTPGIVFPSLELPGDVNGLSWGKIALSSSIQGVYQQAAQITITPMYQPTVDALPQDNGGRYLVVPLDGVKAPNPYLHDLVDESFQALRSRVALQAGWDFLGSLENAYVPLTAPLDPGMGNDWLYTGRAFAVDKIPMDAGWLAVVREDLGAETYWRVYIKPLFQDGSAGIPLHDLPWDFDARNNGNPGAYEAGGEHLSSIPGGYWIDFTNLALAYGWERLPALTNWIASAPASRFNEFASTGGLEWESAMLQLYPPEVLITPSPVVPPTRTVTATLSWFPTPTPSPTMTPRPTFTPYPMPTATVTPGG